MNRTFLVGGAISVFFLTSTWSETLSPDAGAVTEVVNGFHDALRRGDAKAAMELLAPNAIILESGSAETREEYQQHHLAEDIAFSRAVTSTNSTLAVHIDGNVAWVSSTSRATGTFNGRQVNSAGVELMVLTNSPAGWRIRAIHWSNHALKKAD
jgi:ketosteroid isomerase-like protein